MDCTDRSASVAFINLTEELLEKDMVYSKSVSFPALYILNKKYDFRIGYAFDKVFQDKTACKYGCEISWRTWLLESGFSEYIYNMNDGNLSSTIKDEQMWQRNYQKKDSTHNFFGRLCRPLSCGKSFMEYLLERLSDKNLRSHPNFYFDVESPEWVWEELMKNPKQPKSRRASATCCTNMWFRWIPKEEALIVGWIMKHAMWSHLFQDIFSPCNIATVICKEIGIKKAYASVFFCSLRLDETKRAKEFISMIKE